MRSCGDCTLCCKLLGVRALNKQPFEYCSHCNIGSGCKVYQCRPDECKDFNCLWLQGKVDEELKPNSCHVVLADLNQDLEKLDIQLEDDRKVIVAYVDSDYPDAYKEGKIKDLLNDYLKEGTEIVLVEKNRKMLMKWGKVDE